MRYSKRYIFLTSVLVIILFINFRVFKRDVSTVEEFRGASLEADIWNPMVAKDVNSKKIKLTIDGKEYTSENYNLYMDDNRSLMIPVSMLRDSLNCSSHIYKDSKLLVEKHNYSATFELDSDYATGNDGEVELVSAFSKGDDDFYVSVDDLSKLLGYSCDFDIESNMMTASDESESATIFPAKYDLRDKNRVSEIKNQGIYGTCWAFAAISALESSMMPEQKNIFSVDNMIFNNSFKLNLYDGGEYTMGMAYLAAWQGPIYDEQDPYGDNKFEKNVSPVAHVQEMRVIEGKAYDKIKEAVFKYGGVQTSLYSTIKSAQSYSPYYNRNNKAYCYIGTEKSNHDVVIIGWDDNYSKDNFPKNLELEGDGAFICQNSWGTSFGDDGIFYVSYYDTNIGTRNVVYTRVEATDNYDNIYQSDLCGMVGKLGLKKDEIYGANVFEAKGNENITAAGFYATAPNTEYKVFVVKNFEDKDSLAKREIVASGVLEQNGYYTIDFKHSVEVKKGEKYAVMVYLKTPESVTPMAIEYDSGDTFMQKVDLSDGEGYISRDGIKFQEAKVSKTEKCNLCIKAFTNNR